MSAFPEGQSAAAFLRRAWTAAGLRAPGVLVCAVVALAAMFVADHYGGPVMLFALLMGIAFHFLSQEGRCVGGIDFASRTILRIGVALLGARITADQIAGLGVVPVLIIIAAVISTLLAGRMAARALGLDPRFGILTGGATAICGASAALAISAVLPQHKDHERQTLFAVIGVTTLSTVAMVLYPVISGAAGFGDTYAGFFLGGTIHDVAQVVGAGYSVSEQAGDVATYTKMLRVALLLPVVVAISFVMRRDMAHGEAASGAKSPPLVPWFLVIFSILVLVNSLGIIPDLVREGMNDLSRFCLVVAIAGLGMKTALKKLAAVGRPAIALIVAETVFMALFVLIAMEVLM